MIAYDSLILLWLISTTNVTASGFFIEEWVFWCQSARMALETPEMDRLVTFHRLSKKIWAKIIIFRYFTWGWTSSKNSKGIQRKSKGNQRKCKGKSKEITGNQRKCKGNFWKMPKPTEKHWKNIIFDQIFFWKSIESY